MKLSYYMTDFADQTDGGIAATREMAEADLRAAALTGMENQGLKIDENPEDLTTEELIEAINDLDDRYFTGIIRTESLTDHPDLVEAINLLAVFRAEAKDPAMAARIDASIAKLRA